MAIDLGAFMATMVAQSPPVPIARVVTLVRERFGLEVHATRLTGERDENIKLTTYDGAEYVLKIASVMEDAAVAELQTAALLHLQRTDAALPCPRVLRTLDGDTAIRFEDAPGRQRTARVVSYLPGRLLAESGESSRQRAACGHMAGRLARALGRFGHPAAHRAVIWDLRQVRHLGLLLEQLPGFEHRSAALALLARIVPPIEARLPRMRQQVVHNDLNRRNILVDATDDARVTGVIDFGDLICTALIADVGIAGAELIARGCADPDCARACVLDVVRAYHECVPLLPPELSILGTLVAARLLMNVVVHEWYVRHNPLSRHCAPLDRDFVRAQLELADGLPMEDLRL